MEVARIKRQLVIGSILLSILTILGSIQVVISPFRFIRGVAIIAVIWCSAGIGAFVRELFSINKNSNS